MKYALSCLFLVLFLCGGVSDSALAQSQKQELETLKKNMAVKEKRKKELEGKAATIQKDIQSNQKKLVDLGYSIRKNEKRLHSIEAKIDELEGRQAALQEDLKQGRADLAKLVLALQRLRRTPSQALIAKPGAPLQAAQTALLMEEIIPSLQSEAEKLNDTLTELASVSGQLLDEKELALAESHKLKTKKKQLDSLTQERKNLYAKTREDIGQHEKDIKQIAARAKDLETLIRDLEQKRTASRSAKTPSPPLPSRGDSQLPVTGSIRVAYDAPDAFGAPSQGIKIEGRPGGVAIAPMGGTVRFAGYFKNYGNMIIIEHKGGYHSLIAGVEKIDTVVGQDVASGEPIGALGRDKKPVVYYELRYKGTPVNPTRKVG